MKRYRTSAALCSAAILAAAITGCGTTAPSKELVEARELYTQAANGPAAQVQPDMLLTAKQALDAAERAHADDPASAMEQHRAYLAQRRAQMAMVAASKRVAEQQREQAQQEYIELSEKERLEAKQGLAETNRKLGETSQRLNQVRQELAEKGDQLGAKAEELREQEKMLAARKAELEKEREARKRAEQEAEEAKKKAAAAMASLEEIAKVKAEKRGWVITLSGSVLFATGKHELMPIAKQKLEQVAQALKDAGEEKTFVVEGHTDNVGPDHVNMELSRKRAESVRSYLIEQGVDPKRIKAVGRGESQPVAPNTTPDGRANNRRVEIVVN